MYNCHAPCTHQLGVKNCHAPMHLPTWCPWAEPQLVAAQRHQLPPPQLQQLGGEGQGVQLGGPGSPPPSESNQSVCCGQSPSVSCIFVMTLEKTQHHSVTVGATSRPLPLSFRPPTLSIARSLATLKKASRRAVRDSGKLEGSRPRARGSTLLEGPGAPVPSPTAPAQRRDR